LFPKDP
jgi:hypothetical protein